MSITAVRHQRSSLPGPLTSMCLRKAAPLMHALPHPLCIRHPAEERVARGAPVCQTAVLVSVAKFARRK